MSKHFTIIKMILAMVLLFAASSSYSQSKTSKVFKFDINDTTEVFMPPSLYVDIDFTDSNNNGILEANESGNIGMKISNLGGTADNVDVQVYADKPYEGLALGQSKFNVTVPRNGEISLSVPIEATSDIQTDSVRIHFSVKEPLGYGITAEMLLSTFEQQKAKLQVQGVTIVDAGRGLRAAGGNPDGKLQKGEVAKAFITIQNIGQAPAESVSYSIISKDPNVSLFSDIGVVNEVTGKIDGLKIGEVAEISVRISPNNNYKHTGEYLPLFITAKDDGRKIGLTSVNLPIPLGTSPEKPKIFQVEADVDKLLAMKRAEVFSTSDRISSKMKIRDISVAPYGEPIYKDGIAIVIGVEKNSYGIAPAPYAARDAQIMAKYFQTTLGINDVRLFTDAEVTKSKISDIFDKNGELMRSVEKGVTDVFVFYSGHGMPDADSESKGKYDIYLFPYDGRKDMIKERGYSLNRLYSNLSELGAKSVTVILDACFSGSSRQSTSYAGVSIGNTKGIRVSQKDMGATPWLDDPNFRLFTSSSGDQTSLGFDQSQSGLFTYYIALGLQGDADLDEDGTITFKELNQYVFQNVSETAKQIRNGDQTPMLFGNDDMIISIIK